MPEASYDLREVACATLAEMSERKRVAFMTEVLVELSGPQAIEHPCLRQPAQASLLKAVAVPVEAAPDPELDRDQIWAWSDTLPEKVKDTAKARLRLIQIVEQLEEAPGRHLAVITVAEQEKVSPRTIWNLLDMIGLVERSDHLAYLASRHRAAKPKRERAACNTEFLDW